MTEPLIEERLRRGLADAAAALPEAEPTLRPISLKGGYTRGPNHVHRQRKWTIAAGIAAATSLIAGVGAAVVLANQTEPTSVAVNDGPPESGQLAGPNTSSGPTTTVSTDEVQTTNGRVPGEAVAVDEEIRLYDADGTQTGSVSISPLQAATTGASSDLNGGWVVCGTDGERPEGVPPEGSDKLIWFPAEAEPIQLDETAECLNGLQVIDSVYGPMVVRNPIDGGGLQGIVLATGATHTFPVGDGHFRWAATSHRLLELDEAGSLHLYDLMTGEELPIADITAPGPADISLAPDGESVAVAVDTSGTDTASSDLIVYDLESGEELYRGSFENPVEERQLSYDGTKVAIGSYFEGTGDPFGPVTVIDIDSGEQYTLDVYGRLL